MSDIDPPECPTCHCNVDIESLLTVVVPHTLSPHTQTYYHSDCYDPWADRPGCGAADPVNSPPHYRWLPKGVEVIDITETLGFCLGNVIKYTLRADHKGKPLEDLRKARWYLDREIANRESDK